MSQTLDAAAPARREYGAVPTIELLRVQKQALEMLVRGFALTDVLEHLARLVETHAPDDVVASILLLENGRLYTGAAPSLPADYNAAIDGLEARTGVGTCCHAAATGSVVVTPDIAADPAWAALKALPLGLGLAAAWSQPILGENGRVLGTIGTYFRTVREPDAAERALVETLAQTAALAIQRARRDAAAADQLKLLDLAFEAAEMGAWNYDLVADLCRFDARARRLYNLPADAPDHGPEGVASVVHPDDIAPMFRAIRNAADPAGDGRYDIDYRIAQADGHYRWLRAWGRAEFQGQGPARRALRIVGASRDVTAQKEAERHRELLVDELNHRVKNTLAVVQSIAAQTLRSARDPGRFAGAFTDRIVALARAHNLLADIFWEAPRIAEVVETSLAPFVVDGHAQAIAWSGPEARVDTGPAVALSLVLHELATNAAKYGALSGGDGGVELNWSMGDGRVGELVWRERGGPPVVEPASRGFGSRLISASERQLGGPVELRFEPDGVRCRMAVALSGR